MSRRIRTIVVGVAGLDDQDPRTAAGADPVLGPAVRLAAALGAQLYAVHAFEVPGESPCAPASPGASSGQRRLAAGVEMRMRAHLAVLPGGGAVRCLAVNGPAAPSLCAAAEDLRADLLVVGASRRGAAWRGILGSTAWQVLVRSTLPVLVVHRAFGAAVRRVLLAADLGAGRNALGHAVDVVEAFFGRDDPEVRCLHVVEEDTLLPAHPAAALEAAGRRRLDRFLDDPRLAASIEGSVRVGDPARETAWEAAEWGADLVVVPTFGRSGEGYGPLGRLGFATARGAPCNVLALPVPGGAAGGRTSPTAAAARAEPLPAAGLSAA